jgi:hypothetical protein
LPIPPLPPVTSAVRTLVRDLQMAVVPRARQRLR